MRLLSWETLYLTFKAICVFTTTCLVGYWILKFMKNEDVSMIEYKSLDDMEDTVLPEFSICIYAPILDGKLKAVGGNVSLEDYGMYLGGMKNASDYRHIDFHNVTLDLFEFLDTVTVGMKGSPGKECKDRHNCPYVSLRTNFVGLWFSLFYKCFGVEVKREYAKQVKQVSVEFKASLGNELSQIKAKTFTTSPTFVTFNYPQQFLKFSEAIEYIWPNSVSAPSIGLFLITSIEVLKRRNKPNEHCLVDWTHFDGLVLHKHLKTVGCSAPYQKTHLPVCTSQDKLQESQYEATEVRKKYYPEPCQEISNIIYNFQNLPSTSNGSLNTVGVVYPDKMKIITQQQLVDIQVLIGNIGGYIGLFLGNKLISVYNFFRWENLSLIYIYLDKYLFIYRFCSNSVTRTVFVCV